MKYRLKKKMAMLLAASMITSQASFVFANDETSVNESSKAESRAAISDGTFRTNLEFSETSSEAYKVVGSGLNGKGDGDNFIYSKTDTEGKNFEYSADVTFNINKGAAALAFGYGGDKTFISQGEDTFAVNLQADGTFKVMEWGKGYARRYT